MHNAFVAGEGARRGSRRRQRIGGCIFWAALPNFQVIAAGNSGEHVRTPQESKGIYIAHGDNCGYSG